MKNIKKIKIIKVRDIKLLIVIMLKFLVCNKGKVKG